MLLKEIICTVKEGNEETFSSAQQKWKALLKCPGFIAQYGGWVKERNNVAIIVAGWKDRESYEKFMLHMHDTIYERTDQGGTIAAIHVKVEHFLQTSEVDTMLLNWLEANNVVLEKKWSLEQ